MEQLLMRQILSAFTPAITLHFFDRSVQSIRLVEITNNEFLIFSEFACEYLCIILQYYFNKNELSPNSCKDFKKKLINDRNKRIYYFNSFRDAVYSTYSYWRLMILMY